MQDIWTSVDSYFEQSLLPKDPILSQVLANNLEFGLPLHDVSPCQGKFLQIMVQVLQASRVLEIGTLGGYSSICMARGLLNDGKLISLEVDSKHVSRSTKYRICWNGGKNSSPTRACD
jgi:predicted O-methyltransferase YrrM